MLNDIFMWLSLVIIFDICFFRVLGCCAATAAPPHMCAAAAATPLPPRPHSKCAKSVLGCS